MEMYHPLIRSEPAWNCFARSWIWIGPDRNTTCTGSGWRLYAPSWNAPLVRAKKQEKRLQLEKALRLAGLEISAGVKKHQKTDGHAWTGSVSLPLPLLNWNRSGIAAAKNQWEAEKFTTEAIHLELLQTLREFHTQAQLWEKRYRISKNRLLPAGRQAHDAALQGYEAGKYTGQLLLDAQKDWLETEKEFLNITRKYHKAVIQLSHLTGDLTLNEAELEEGNK